MVEGRWNVSHDTEKRLGALMARIPFTLAFMGVMTVCTVGLMLSPQGLTAGVERFGFSIDSLARGEWWRILTASVIAHDPMRLFEQLVFIVAMIGVHEALLGTRPSIVIFLVTDVFGNLAMIALFLGPLGPALQFGIPNQANVYDVGMSGGGMALVAGSLCALFKGHERLVLVAGMAALLVKFLIWPQPDSDLLHLLTYSLGWGFAWFRRNRA